MNINTDEWVGSSEAARLLSISPQRVSQLVSDGSLDVLRPWTHVTLVSRRSIAEWLAGARQQRLSAAEIRRWLMKRSGATDVADIELEQARDLLLEFIMEARPRWSKARQDLWALTAASEAWRTGRASV